MGFFARHRKAFRSVIASFGMLFGLLAGCASNPIDNTPTASVTKETSKAAKQLNNIGFPFLTATSSEEGVFTNNSDPKTINGQYSDYWGGTRQLIFKNNSVRNGELNITVLGYSTKQKGSATIFGQSAAKAKTYSASISGKGEAIVELKAQYIAFGTSEVSISIRVDSFTIPSDYSITFVPSDVPAGVFKADGQDIANETTWHDERASFKLEYIFNAQSSFIFESWIVDGESYSNQNPLLFTPTKNGHVISPKIVSNNLAMFSVGGLTFSNLNEAISKAKSGSDKTIVAVKDGTVASGNYTLNSGLSLLIPNEDNATLSDYAKEKPSHANSYQSCTKYRKITFENGAQLTAYGQVVVCSKPFFTGGSSTGIPSGGYGQIVLNQGSSIALESGSKLYAWGFVTGDGEVWAKSGSAVYEMFQMAAWRGGGTTVKMLKNEQKVFVMNQYYVQNIEALLRMDSGAVENTLTGVDVTVFGIQNPCFPFVGNGGMFLLTSGYLLKKYDPNTDRLNIRIYGNGTLSSIAFSLMGYDLNSADYVLPVNNNMTIEIVEGACKTEQDLNFLPGSELIVREGASFEVLSGHNMTFYDGDTWGNYAFGATFRSVQYSPTKRKNRTNSDLVDAKLSLDGTFIVGSGSYLMTTGKEADTAIGARIISPNRTGAVKFTDAGANSYPKTHQYESDYVEIPCSCAKLQNGDHSYVQSAPGNTYTYDKVLDRWNLSANPPVKTGLFKTLDGSTVQTVLLHDDIKQSNYTGLFYYSKKTSASYNAADERYYYLNKGVVSKRNEWWKDSTNGAYYHFGPNQYAYQNVSVVLTPMASGDNPARGIKARHFFDPNAKLLRMVSVDSITSNFSSDMTIANGICYYNGIKAGFGLFENQSHVYLAKDDGTLMKDGTYYVPSHKINNIKDSLGKVLTAGLYYFDENGHMYDSNFKEITRGTAS